MQVVRFMKRQIGRIAWMAPAGFRVRASCRPTVKSWQKKRFCIAADLACTDNPNVAVGAPRDESSTDCIAFVFRRVEC